MKHISISQVANGFSVEVMKSSPNIPDEAREDFVQESFVFTNSAEVVDFVKNTLVDVKEEE